MAALRWLLPVLVLLSGTAAAQLEPPESRVTLAMTDPADATLQAGNATVASFELSVGFAGVYCQAPSTLQLSFAVTGQDAALQVDAPTTVEVPFRTGPVAGGPAGPAPGVASPASTTINVTITAKPTHADANLTLQATAGFTSLPSGCHGANTPEATEASANHTLRILGQTGLTASGSTSSPPASGGGDPKGAPFPTPLLMLVVLAVVGVLRRSIR